MIRVLNLVLLFCLLRIYQAQRPPPTCSEERKRYISFIKESIKSARTENRNSCQYYGQERAEYPVVMGPANLHRLEHHIVCFDKDLYQAIQYVEAKITPVDIGKGSDVTNEVRGALKNFHKICGCDQASHIIPNELGGNGYMANVMPRNANLNTGLWSRVVRKAIKFLKTNAGNNVRAVMVRMAFLYDDHFNVPRPSGYFYEFDLYEGDGIVEEIHGFFENEDHYGVTLETCLGDNNDKLNFVPRFDSKYFERKSCKAEEHPSFYYGPTPPTPSTL